MLSLTVDEFECQFKILYRPLNLYAMRMLNSVDDSEDIVQQAFVDVWEKSLTGVVIENPKAYLYRAVRNRCLNYLSIIKQELPEEELEGDIPDTSQEEMIERSERDARLWKVIDELPLERRKIFLMCKRDGMRYLEIAAELHISIKTVENQMGKALKTLREMAYRIYLFFFG